MMRRATIFVLCVMASAASIRAQDAPIGTTETLHVGTQLVVLDASVTDRKTGRAITGLTPQDFILTEDGAPQTIASLNQDSLPLSLVFLFDATDTVQPVLLQLAMGARRTLDHLREDDEVEVATFSTHVTIVHRFTKSHPDIAFALADASSVHDKNRATLIFEDLYEATELAQDAPTPNSRRVEIWLTDSSSNLQGDPGIHAQSEGAPAVLHAQADVADILGRSGVVVGALVQQSEMTMRERSNPGHSRFGDVAHFADVTGGPVEYTSQVEAVSRFGALIDALRQRYTLGYRPAQAKPAGTVCKLHLALSPAFFAANSEIRAKDIVIRTRQTYTR
jgi:VWFA-related protein